MDNVMALYKSIAETPMQKLMYDQGEDRWLCTLLLQQGWRVEYSAASGKILFDQESQNLREFSKIGWVQS